MIPEIEIKDNVYYHIGLAYVDFVRQNEEAIDIYKDWWYFGLGNKPGKNIFLIYNHPKHYLHEAAKKIWRKI